MTVHTATADAPLPLEEFAEVAEVDQLRAALAEALDAIERPGRPIAANRLRRLRRLAGRAEVPGDDLLTPEERRDDGIARAAARWTDEEAALVDQVIADLAAPAARGHLPACDGLAGNEFTTADVWEGLAGRVPVTKGIAGRMKAAANAGLIVNTGRTVIAPASNVAPSHAQRLTVWRAAL